MSKLTIAVTQFELRAEVSVAGYLEHIDGLVEGAVEAGADLVVFPELASTGLLAMVGDGDLSSHDLDEAYWSHLSQVTPDIVDGLIRISRSRGITLLGGSHIRRVGPAELRNTAYLVRPDGSVQVQDKIHLTPPELDLGLSAGDELLVTEIEGFTVGVLICADIQFPELSRILADRGVNLILCPSLTWNSRGAFRVRTGSHARAIENQLYVAMSPLIGSSGLPVDAPLFTKGNAIVTVPVDKNFGRDNGVGALAEGESESLILFELDRAAVDFSREWPEPPGLKLRRPEIVARLAATHV